MANFRLLVCTNSRINPKNPSCAGQGSEALLKQLLKIANDSNAYYQIEEIKCFGQCDKGPVMRIAPALEFFYHVKESDLESILNSIPTEYS